MKRCECCKETNDLLACADSEQPMVWFCPSHYIRHVNDAHGGKPLSGSPTLEYATHIFSSRD